MLQLDLGTYKIERNRGRRTQQGEHQEGPVDQASGPTSDGIRVHIQVQPMEPKCDQLMFSFSFLSEYSSPAYTRLLDPELLCIIYLLKFAWCDPY